MEMVQVVKPLSLKNDDRLEIVFLGVGSAFAKTLNQTNFLIIKGNDHVLVDCGMKGPQALLDIAGLKTTDIEVILPTHSHADHIAGIEELAITNRYVGIPFLKKAKLKIVITEEYERILWDHSLRGGLEWNERTEEGIKLSFGNYFDTIRPRWKTFQPREIWEVYVGGIKIEMFRTKHIPEQSENWEASFVSYGLFVDDQVFLSCDTRYDPELLAYYAPKSVIMYHDVQFFPGAVHAPLQNLRTQPPEVKSKLVFKHYTDNFREQDITDFAGWAQQGIRYIF